MTRKLIYSSLLAIMLIGCGGGDSNSTDDNKNNNQEQQQEGTEGRVENNQSNEPNELSLKMENKDISKKVDIKYLNEGNIQRLITLLNQNGYDSFSQKHVNTVYSDFDDEGQEFYIITFDEDGYIVLNPNLNANAIYDLDDIKVYNSVSKTETTNINIDWMEIIADEVSIPFEKLRKSYYKVDKKLITKITWTSGNTRTDFDLFVKSPDGQICNYKRINRNKEEWGTIFLRDDQGRAYTKSFEAFSVDLDKMDEYATKNNLFGIDGGRYKFYVARYTGANINYTFSYGLTGECSASSSNNCPRGGVGNWIRKVDKIGENNAIYAVQYKPKRASTNNTFPHNQSVDTSVPNNSWKRYTIQGQGNTKITIKITNLSSDVDLYVRKNNDPIVSTKKINTNNLCVPFEGGTKSEICAMTVNSTDTLHIGIYGANAGNFRIKSIVSGNNNNIETLSFPFQADEEWVVCQGYNTNPITHHDVGRGRNGTGVRVGSNLTYALDLATNPNAASGTYGCNGASNYSSGEEILAPATGYITRLVSADMVCLRYDNQNLGSMMLGHFARTGRDVILNEAIRKGQVLGTIGTGTVSGGPFAHIHMGLYSDQDCRTPIPFGNVFGDGTNYSSDNSDYQWYGEVLGD